MVVEVPLASVLISVLLTGLPAMAAGAIVGGIAAGCGRGWHRVWRDALLAGVGFAVSLPALLAYPLWPPAHWPVQPTFPFPIELPLACGALVPVAIELATDRKFKDPSA